MPFEKEDQWPAGLLKIFEIARGATSTLENRYYGACDALLNHCFMTDDFTYIVSPRYSPANDRTTETVYFLVLLVVGDQGKPVLFLEVKQDSWVQQASSRKKADSQMRDKFDAMLHDCPIPRLWGISVLGTSMRVYSASTATLEVTPRRLERPDPDRVIPQDYLENAWSLDILSQVGFHRVKEIVTEIKLGGAK